MSESEQHEDSYERYKSYGILKIAVEDVILSIGYLRLVVEDVVLEDDIMRIVMEHVILL